MKQETVYGVLVGFFVSMTLFGVYNLGALNEKAQIKQYGGFADSYGNSRWKCEAQK